jgi:hypothetical protein
MKKLLVVCLSALLLSSASLAAPDRSEAFNVADRIGELNERCFFLFSTSAGSYTLRQDGMGEFTSPKGMRRVFYLKLGAKVRIDSVYFLEHEGDLFLLYGVRDAKSEWTCLLRMEQTKRKLRWTTAIDSTDVGAPVIQGDFVLINTIEVRKADGHVRQD